MNTLQKFSPKRLAEIAEGKRLPNGKMKMTAEQFRESKSIKRALSKTPKSSRAKAMKEADRWFSEWIRLRDSDENGIAVCITSGTRKHWRQMDCGHWISRAKMATRYHEWNAHAQSKNANRFQGGHFLEHGIAIERIHGKGTQQCMSTMAGIECKRTTADFQRIADQFKALVLHIRDTEPGKYFAKG